MHYDNDFKEHARVNMLWMVCTF